MRIISSFLICMPFFSGVASAQNGAHRMLPVPKIDGAIHPERNSDQEAITLFYVSTSLPTLSTPTDLRRVHSQLGRMGLNELDRAAALRSINTFHDSFLPYKVSAASMADRLRMKPDAEVARQRVMLIRSVDVLALRSYQALSAQLSTEGATKLREHVAYLKTKMKVVAAPTM